MEEMIFNSEDEAFQKLADITGKKIMIPDKSDPKIAADIDFDKEIEKHQSAAEKIKEIKDQYDSAMKSVEEISKG